MLSVMISDDIHISNHRLLKNKKTPTSLGAFPASREVSEKETSKKTISLFCGFQISRLKPGNHRRQLPPCQPRCASCTGPPPTQICRSCNILHGSASRSPLSLSLSSPSCTLRVLGMSKVRSALRKTSTTLW